MNTILTDDERRELMVRYGSSATPDENNDYMTGDYPLVCASEAAVLAKLREQEPADYQILILGNRWTHCAKHIYDASQDRSIVRALYAAPLPAVVQVPQGIDVEDLRDRLVAISSAVADDDHRAAQSMIGETLRLLAAAPEAPAQAIPAPWREAVKVAREALEALTTEAVAVKNKLDGDLPYGSPVHPLSSQLTWPIATAIAALAQLDALEGVE